MIRTGKGPSSGRTRLTILLATAAAFFLVPAAAQAAEGTSTIAVTIEGSGSGEVTSDGGFEESGVYEGHPAIECSYAAPGPQTGVCEALGSEEGELVDGIALRAIAAPGSEFVSWEVLPGPGVNGIGCDEGPELCFVSVIAGEEETAQVIAVFEEEPAPEFELEISTDGTGLGEVECEVNGGSAEPCEAEYEEGTEVALVPVAETGSEFTGWSGDCTGTGACVLTMDADKEVTATFDEEEEPTPEFDLTIVKAGSGSG